MQPIARPAIHVAAKHLIKPHQANISTVVRSQQQPEHVLATLRHLFRNVDDRAGQRKPQVLLELFVMGTWRWLLVGSGEKESKSTARRSSSRANSEAREASICGSFSMGVRSLELSPDAILANVSQFSKAVERESMFDHGPPDHYPESE